MSGKEGRRLGGALPGELRRGRIVSTNRMDMGKKPGAASSSDQKHLKNPLKIKTEMFSKHKTFLTYFDKQILRFF